MPRRRYTEMERIEIPEAMVDVAERRVHPFIAACAHEVNMLRSLTLSCYLQGLQDGLQVVEQRPTLLAELRAIAEKGANCDIS